MRAFVVVVGVVVRVTRAAVAVFLCGAVGRLGACSRTTPESREKHRTLPYGTVQSGAALTECVATRHDVSSHTMRWSRGCDRKVRVRTTSCPACSGGAGDPGSRWTRASR